MVTDNKVSTTHNVFTPDLSKHGVKYQGLASANPYANVEYRQSWIQKFLERIGFRTNKDAYLESMALQAQEYDNALMQKEYDERYNDPLAQADRERAAGLNPNLTGNVSAGESSPIQDDGNPPIAPVADDLNIVSGFASFVLQGVQSAFNLASGVVDLRSKKLANITTEDGLISDALMNVLPAKTDEPLNYNQLYSVLKNAYGGHIKKRYFPDFVNRAYAFMNGLNFSDKEYKTRDSRVGARKDFYFKSSGSDYNEENEVMEAVSKELSDLALETSKLVQKASQKSSDASMSQSEANKAQAANNLAYENNVRPEVMANQLEYEQALDPSRLAKNEMSMSDIELGLKRNEKEYSDYQKLLRSSFKSILSKLDALDESGNWFAPYAKAFISAYLLNALPGISISGSSSPKGSRWSFGLK